MEDNKCKRSRCRFAFPDLKESGLTWICVNEKKTGKETSIEIDRATCEECPHFNSKYIEYPITIDEIENRFAEDCEIDLYERRIGDFVKIRPCSEKYNNKTYLGIMLGYLPIGAGINYFRDTKKLQVSARKNPAIYVPELKKIIYGMESWWGFINSPDELKDITNDDIGNVWYVQMLKKMTEKDDKNE